MARPGVRAQDVAHELVVVVDKRLVQPAGRERRRHAAAARANEGRGVAVRSGVRWAVMGLAGARPGCAGLRGAACELEKSEQLPMNANHNSRGSARG